MYQKLQPVPLILQCLWTVTLAKNVKCGKSSEHNVKRFQELTLL